MSPHRALLSREDIDKALADAVRRHSLKTEAEIDAMIDSRLEQRMGAWETRMLPTMDALRDGAQSALMTNMLLVGDDRFEVKGFIPETRERFTKMENRQDAMHEENKRLNRKVIRRQGVIMRCVKWLTRKDEKGQWRVRGLMASAASAGASLMYAVHHYREWLAAIHRHIH